MEERRLATLQDLYPAAADRNIKGKEDFDSVGVQRFPCVGCCHRLDRLDCISLRVIEKRASHDGQGGVVLRLRDAHARRL